MSVHRLSHRTNQLGTDEFVIYYSVSDKCWIAHSLRTDQIGTGISILPSLVDLLLALDTLAGFAGDNSAINLFRNAPSEVKKKAKAGQNLPHELYEIAYKKAFGKWPEDFKIMCHSSCDNDCFKGQTFVLF